MIVLAIDTALSACSAAVLAGDQVLAARSEPMVKGHQERLALLVGEVMDEAGIDFGKLDRIGVTAGPGSFTGLRVGLAFAKGLSLALDAPAVGVGSLEALAATLRPREPVGEIIAACIDARRRQVYLQLFRDGRPLDEPEAMSVEDAVIEVERLGGVRSVQLAGSGAGLLAPYLPRAHVEALETPDPVVVARLAAAVQDPPPLRPIYLRAPDAKLPG